MKKDLIERLLNEQTTPDEEHLVAQMLQQGEDMEQWLTEDETAEYDRIVSQRRAKRRQLRWAIAAVIVALIVVGTIVLFNTCPFSPYLLSIHIDMVLPFLYMNVLPRSIVD